MSGDRRAPVAAPVVAAGVAVGAGAAVGAMLRSVSPVLLDRSASVGRPVTLAGGPVAAVALLAALPFAGGVAALPAVLAAAAAGLVDDLAGTGSPADAAASPAVRGFAGHLGALRTGRLTTGAGKVLAIGAGSVLSAGLFRAGAARHRPLVRATAVVADGALIAGTANLVNLLDLRPGRAGKATGVAAGTLLLRAAAGPHRPAARRSAALLGAVLGALAAELPRDLAGEWMLGDCGANALGAAVGAAVVAGRGAAFRSGWLAVVVALTAASERVSFSAVIAGSRVLSWLDRLGRPAGPTPAAAATGAGT